MYIYTHMLPNPSKDGYPGLIYLMVWSADWAAPLLGTALETRSVVGFLAPDLRRFNADMGNVNPGLINHGLLIRGVLLH